MNMWECKALKLENTEPIRLVNGLVFLCRV